MTAIKIYKKQALLFVVLIQTFTSSAQQKTTLIQDRLGWDTITCIYNLTGGRLNGKYVSWYHNGNKKSEGVLENGYRNGRWMIWDSTGRKRMERIYKNPFEFERIFPPVPNEGPIPLLIQNQYKLEYDSNGIVKYAVLKAEDAIWRHKFWRVLEPVNNEILFTNNRLLNLFKKLTRNSQK